MTDVRTSRLQLHAIDVAEGERIVARTAVEIWEQLLESAEDDLDAELARRRVAASSGSRRTRSDLDKALRQAAEVARRPA